MTVIPTTTVPNLPVRPERSRSSFDSTALRSGRTDEPRSRRVDVTITSPGRFIRAASAKPHLRLRDDRQKQVRLPPAARMKPYPAPEEILGTVVPIVVCHAPGAARAVVK